jgi:hypothetical protein
LACGFAEVAELFQCLPVAGGRCREIAGKPLHYPELVEHEGVHVAVAEVAEHVECLLQAGGGGIVPGQPVHGGQRVQGVGLASG